MSVAVTVAGQGHATTVELPDGSSLQVALDEANVEASDVNVALNGERAAEPAQTTVQNGDQVTVSPREAKLG